MVQRKHKLTVNKLILNKLTVNKLMVNQVVSRWMSCDHHLIGKLKRAFVETILVAVWLNPNLKKFKHFIWIVQCEHLCIVFKTIFHIDDALSWCVLVLGFKELRRNGSYVITIFEEGNSRWNQVGLK